MKKWGIATIATVIFTVALFTYVKTVPPLLLYTNGPISSTSHIDSTLKIGGQTIHTTIVDSPASRERGLSGRLGLDPDEGMLFVFEKDGMYAFWMKDMLFSIDMIWISADGHVVDFYENVSPDTYPKAFSPKASSRYVLELSANTVKRLNVHIGDIVRL